MSVARFEVAWCPAGPPRDSLGEHVLENAPVESRAFSTHEAAHAFAVTVLPVDWFGAVQITRWTPVSRAEAMCSDENVACDAGQWWQQVGDHEEVS